MSPNQVQPVKGPKDAALPPGYPYWPMLVLAPDSGSLGAIEAALEKAVTRSAGELEMPVVVLDERLPENQTRMYKVLADVPDHVVVLAAAQLRAMGYDAPAIEKVEEMAEEIDRGSS